MKTTIIEDAADRRLDPFRDLKARAGRRANDVIVESYLVVERLLESSWPVTTVLATESQLERLAASPVRHEKLATAEVLVATGPIMEAVVGFDMHRGCVARAPRPAPAAETLVELARHEQGLLLFVEQVTDPANIGALVRSAAAFGVRAIVFDAACGDPYCRKALRAAAGHTFSATMLECPIPHALDVLSADSARPWTRIAATLSPRATRLTTLRSSARVALVVGNEGFGLSPEVLSRVDVEVTIPMAPGVDSLNVGAATAVLLYALAQTLPTG